MLFYFISSIFFFPQLFIAESSAVVIWNPASASSDLLSSHYLDGSINVFHWTFLK